MKKKGSKNFPSHTKVETIDSSSEEEENLAPVRHGKSVSHASPKFSEIHIL
jgi:hypothetical protein